MSTTERTQKPEQWRVKIDKPLVEAVDDHKWEQRTSRYKLMKRMLLLCLKLMETVSESGESEFERLESSYGLDRLDSPASPTQPVELPTPSYGRKAEW